MNKIREEIFFDRLDQAMTAAQEKLNRAGAVLAEPMFYPSHIAYTSTSRFSMKLATIKGKPTRKYFHISIYRMDSGRYELTSYIS